MKRQSDPVNSIWLALAALAICGCASTDAPANRSSAVYALRSYASEVSSSQANLDRETYPAIRKCIKAKGFDFRRPNLAGPDEVMDVDSSEYLLEWGYGQSTAFTLDRLDPFDDPKRSAKEPNEQQYNQALLGNKGCFLQASIDTVGKKTDSLARSYAVRLQDAKVRVFSSSDGTKALEQWRTCLAKAGYSYQSPDAARDAFSAKFTTLRFSIDPDGNGLVDEAETVDALARQKLLQAEERATAKADALCRDATLQDLRKQLATASDTIISDFQAQT